MSDYYNSNYSVIDTNTNSNTASNNNTNTNTKKVASKIINKALKLKNCPADNSKPKICLSKTS
mgnify:CR=1 FL=1